MSGVFVRLDWLTGLKIAIGGTLIFWSNSTFAQVTPDTTLGAESSVVTPNVEIQGVVSDRIDEGAIRGSNLFHSFQEFNVGEGRGVYFTNPQGIENILSRVTGANRSEILGRLGVLGNANLFLINPNGIVFGRNASLDVEGSFVATTANAIRLGETGLFSATDPASSNLLSINPSALFYNVLAKEAAIVNRSQEGLSVRDGRSLLLVGGQVNLESGVLKAPGGRVELGGLNAPGTIALSKDGNNLRLSFPEGMGRADVLLTKSSSGSNGSEVSVRAGGKGSITINARDVEISGGSALRGGIEPRSGSVDAVAGDITLNATGTIEVKQQRSVIENVVDTGAIGNAGNINITTESLSITGNAQLSASTSGKGDGGSITIDVREAVTFDDGDAVSVVQAGAEGDAGNIKIKARSLSLTNESQLNAFVSDASEGKPAGIGNAGDVIVNVKDAITISGTTGKLSGIFNRLQTGTTGSAGNINITTGSLSITGNARLNSSTSGKGDGGSITIDARDAVSFDDGDAFSRVEAGGEGSAGDIKITSGSLSITGNAQLSASTSGKGNGGSITIDAREAVTFDDGEAFSTVGAGGEGNAGDINIISGSLTLMNGGQLGAFVRAASDDKPAGIGNAGDVIVNVKDAITISGTTGKLSGIFNRLQTGATGSAGNINITTGSLSMIGNAQLSASTFGKGDAGSVNITATNAIKFDGKDKGGNSSGAFSQVNSGAEGKAGGVTISTGLLELTNGAEISASTRGKGNAGGITINARDAVTFNDGEAFSTVEAGAVGNASDIKITAGSLSLINGGQLGAFVRAGSGGKPAGIGNAGNTIINVRDALTISGVSGKRSGIFNELESGTTGSAGNINITTGSLSMTGDARLTASTSGKGNAGGITIDAREAVTFNDGEAFSTVEAGAVGDAGDLKITAGSLSLMNGGQLLASVRDASEGKPAGIGNAGDVIVNVKDAITISGTTGKLSGIFNDLESGTTGSAGNINITTGSLSMIGNAQLSASTRGKGNAGGITINARDAVTFNDGEAFSTVGAGAVGDAGDIKITAGSLSLINGGQLGAFVRAGSGGKPAGIGNAGDVIVNVKDAITISGTTGKLSGIFNDLESGTTGSAGNINITTGSLSMIGNAQLSASTVGKGNAGSVNITATNAIKFDGKDKGGNSSGAFSQVNSGAEGKAGGVTIATGSLELTNGAQLSASTFGKGDAGSVNITATNAIKFDGKDKDGNPSGAFSRVNSGAEGKAGGVTISTGLLELTNGAEISASTRGKGNAGGITINARDAVTFNDGEAFSTVGAGAVGDAGDLKITAGSLSLINGGQLGAFVRAGSGGKPAGIGNAGNTIINVRDALTISGVSGKRSGIFNELESGTTGSAGNINITTGSLSMTGDARLTASTSGKGNAGNIKIQAEQISLSSNASIQGDVTATGNGQGANIELIAKGQISLIGGENSPSTGESTRITLGLLGNAQGLGGTLNITAGSLVLKDGAIIKNSTEGEGDAGSIYVKAGTVDISGSVPTSGLPSGLYTNTTTNGKAGDIRIETDKFRISDGAVLSALTDGDGNAGRIAVTATKTFEALNGGQLVVTTSGKKPAGNISIKAEEVTFSGSDPSYEDRYNRLTKYNNSVYRLTANNSPASGVFASTFSEGDGGNVSLETTTLNLNDRALLSSQSQGTGRAGNISINARRTFNANNSNITTSATQSNGGAIAIKASDIRLYGDSDITTDVGSGTGGGGDITLTANSIIAFDDSDILAFAQDGKGGNITLNTPAFFGQNYQRASSGTAPDTLDGNNRVDINASGAISSGVIIVPDTSFIQESLSELPENVIDTGSLIANSCIARGSRQQEGNFVITGSGGLPSRPGEALMSQYTFNTARTVSNTLPSANSPRRPWQKGDPIVEPQGVYRLSSGHLVLSRECL